MAAPKTTTWDLEPHSRAKHEILRRYLQAWMGILGRAGYPEFVYIDGFAGPGRYSKGEAGAPVLSLEVALDHQHGIGSSITFLFVERRSDRAKVLRQVLDEIERPPRFDVQVKSDSTFEQAVGKLLDDYVAKGQRPPPILAFIDPFGWKGVPFQLVQRILSYPSCETLITFMYEEINRFVKLPEQEQNFDAFFGTHKWREGIQMTIPAQRNRFSHDLYLSQLHQKAGVKYVRSFEMRNDTDVTEYYLFFATNNILGLKKMKESMWRVDPSGEFKFSDASNPRQLVLFGREPQFDILRGQVIERFHGQETTVGDVEKFVVEETAFRETHYKKQVLRILETSEPPQLLPINPPAHRLPGQYPDPSLIIRFV